MRRMSAALSGGAGGDRPSEAPEPFDKEEEDERDKDQVLLSCVQAFIPTESATRRGVRAFTACRCYSCGTCVRTNWTTANCDILV